MNDGDQAESSAIRVALGIRAGLRVWVGGHNLEARRAIEAHLTGTDRPPTGPVDAAFICPSDADEAAYFAAKLRKRPTERTWVLCENRPARGAAEVAVAAPAVDRALADKGFHAVETVELSEAISCVRFTHGSTSAAPDSKLD